MDISLQDLLLWLVIGVPLGIGGVLLFLKGMKKTNRFFNHDYGENKREQFKDILLSCVYLICGAFCLVVAGVVFSEGVKDVGMYLLFVPAFILFWCICNSYKHYRFLLAIVSYEEDVGRISTNHTGNPRL